MYYGAPRVNLGLYLLYACVAFVSSAEFKMNNVMLLGILFHKLSPTVSTDINCISPCLIVRPPFPVECLSTTAAAMLSKAEH